uniref:Uncharacterized protein n=1 Tax=Laticauda laticaudata TaxID=8630 RepID=A0A8C5RIM0_LATLA
MGLFNQAELCPYPAALEKGQPLDEQKCSRSPDCEGFPAPSSAEGDSLENDSPTGSHSSGCAEDDEASSTESTQNGHEGLCSGSDPKGDQCAALSKISALENRLKELHHRKNELNIEMDLEGALLQGELQEERQDLCREEERLVELKERLVETELRCREEREKEKARLQRERQRVEELQRQHAESQIHLNNQPESMRERMQKQLQETSEMLEGALRCYEDLEFQQLERESHLEEEKEAVCHALTEEITQLQNSINQRKKRVQKLEGQALLTQEQMMGVCQRFAQEEGEAVSHLNAEKSRLMDRSQEYSANGEDLSENKEGHWVPADFYPKNGSEGHCLGLRPVGLILLCLLRLQFCQGFDWTATDRQSTSQEQGSRPAPPSSTSHFNAWYGFSTWTGVGGPRGSYCHYHSWNTPSMLTTDDHQNEKYDKFFYKEVWLKTHRVAKFLKMS